MPTVTIESTAGDSVTIPAEEDPKLELAEHNVIVHTLSGPRVFPRESIRSVSAALTQTEINESFASRLWTNLDRWKAHITITRTPSPISNPNSQIPNLQSVASARAELLAAQAKLSEIVSKAIPVGSTITWTCGDDLVLSGRVLSHKDNGLAVTALIENQGGSWVHTDQIVRVELPTA